MSMDGCQSLSKREEVVIRGYVKEKLKDADIAYVSIMWSMLQI